MKPKNMSVRDGVGNLIIRADSTPFLQGFQIHGFTERSDYYVSGCELKTRDEAEITSPMCFMSTESAKILMNDLWRAGIRPDELDQSAGELKAKGEHLGDLRNILQASLEKNGFKFRNNVHG